MPNTYLVGVHVQETLVDLDVSLLYRRQLVLQVRTRSHLHLLLGVKHILILKQDKNPDNLWSFVFNNTAAAHKSSHYKWETLGSILDHAILKLFIDMVPDSSIHCTWHKNIGLASIYSYLSIKSEMDSIRYILRNHLISWACLS